MEGSEKNKPMEQNNAPFRLSSVEKFLNYNISINIYPENKKVENEQKSRWPIFLNYSLVFDYRKPPLCYQSHLRKVFSEHCRIFFDWQHDTNQKQQLHQPAKAAGRNAWLNLSICIFWGSLNLFQPPNIIYFFWILWGWFSAIGQATGYEIGWFYLRNQFGIGISSKYHLLINRQSGMMCISRKFRSHGWGQSGPLFVR